MVFMSNPDITLLTLQMLDRIVKRGEFNLKHKGKADVYIDCNSIPLSPYMTKYIPTIWEFVRDYIINNRSGERDIYFIGQGAGVHAMIGGLVSKLNGSIRDFRVHGLLIRDKVKEYGMGNRIDGEVPTFFSLESSLVLLEDVVSTGGSMLESIDICEKELNKVPDLILSLVDRRSEEKRKDKFKGIPYVYIWDEEMLI